MLHHVLFGHFLSVTDSVINESMRLASGVFMVRYITEDIDFALANGKEHRLRKGDRVAIYPPSIHQDPEIFEDPLVIIYFLLIANLYFKFLNGACWKVE